MKSDVFEHPVFLHFNRTPAFDDADFHTNFVGSRARHDWFPSPPQTDPGPQMTNNVVLTYANGGLLPDPLGDDWYEWVDVLEAINAAQNGFAMIELGAGFGRWVVNAALAVQRHKTGISGPLWLCAVEPSPTRFSWMRQHFQDNGLNPDDHCLLRCGVSVDGAPAVMPAETHVDARNGYGNRLFQVSPLATRIVLRDRNDQPVGHDKIKTQTIGQIIGRRTIDLLDMDIEGDEFIALEPFTDLLAAQVRRIHIGTHAPEIERQLCTLLTDTGFVLTRFLRCNDRNHTRNGVVTCLNGVQSWFNPALA